MRALKEEIKIYPRFDQLNAWAPDYLEAVRLELKRKGITEGDAVAALHLPTQRLAEPVLKNGVNALEQRKHTSKKSSRRKRKRGKNPSIDTLPNIKNWAQGALIALDYHTESVSALVGSVSFEQSTFNRATQACRQLGSTIKPFIFGLALEEGMTWSTLLSDAPISIYDRQNQLLWKPRGVAKSNGVGVTMERALARSMNLPTVHLTQKLGVKQTNRWISRFGLPEQPQDLSMALGSGCAKPLSLTQAYATIARGGLTSEAHLILRHLKPNGELSISHDHISDLWLPELLIPWEMAQHKMRSSPRVMSHMSAYALEEGLKSVIKKGTAKGLKNLPIETAGKTGSTDHYDAWFAGYHSAQVITVWVGSDQNKIKLGRGEGGARTALPIWLDFVNGTLEGVPVHLKPQRRHVDRVEDHRSPPVNGSFDDREPAPLDDHLDLKRSKRAPPLQSSPSQAQPLMEMEGDF